MSPVRIALVALGWAVTAGLCVAQVGWRRAPLRFADAVGWSLITGVGPQLIALFAGVVVAWCLLPLFAAATWFGGAAAIGALNFLVLQWFGVRLVSVKQRVLCGDGPRSFRHLRWKLLRWVWPLTGWWSPHRWIARRL